MSKKILFDKMDSTGKHKKYDQYNHRIIDKNWQEIWEKRGSFKVTEDQSKKKFYVLPMFPYPSGAGLHVGHGVVYTASDVAARFKRAEGYNVMHPIGWDSFGLPTEQYAMSVGEHPALVTKRNVTNMKRQLRQLGCSFDWDREFDTSHPDYYKWTQWIFTLLHQKGLAYESYRYVNYCPALRAVLANEEVHNGKAKEGGFAIEQRLQKQWILKITDYAEKLLEDLEALDWPEHVKVLQRNWIGKSDGVEICFHTIDESKKIPIFTTRIDTIKNAVAVSIGIDHPILKEYMNEELQNFIISVRKEVNTYLYDHSWIPKAYLLPDRLMNPITNEHIPLFVTDYVSSDYGTGAVMCVPAASQIDFFFAKRMHLSINPLYQPWKRDTIKDKKILSGELPWEEDGCLIDDYLDLVEKGSAQQKVRHAVTEHLKERGLIKEITHYKLRDWLFSRQRYWGEPMPLYHFEDGTIRVLNLDELPFLLPEEPHYEATKDHKTPLEKDEEWLHGKDTKTGKLYKKDSNTMPQWAGSSWYFLRYCDPQNNNEAWNKAKEQYWMPVDLYIGGVEHAVLHLLYARFWHKVLYDAGYVSTPEPFPKLRTQGLVYSASYQDEQHKYYAPDYVEEIEPNNFVTTDGVAVKQKYEKMSKSKLNGISPDEVIEMYGADAFRLYLMFMGPLDQQRKWDSKAIMGCRRFLVRLYNLVNTANLTNHQEQLESSKIIRECLSTVYEYYNDLRFNLVVSTYMENINRLFDLQHPIYNRAHLSDFVIGIAPLAPHLAEELWSFLGNDGLITDAKFPFISDDMLEEKSDCIYIIQINGKLRATIEANKGMNVEEILTKAMKNIKIQHHIGDQPIKRKIFIQDKLLNLIV